jgi:hypothetical protein
MAAKVFVSVSAALDAVYNMAVGQRIVVMGRHANVVSIPGGMTFKYARECVVASTARPADGRNYGTQHAKYTKHACVQEAE